MLRYSSPHTGRSRRRPWAGRTRLRGGDDDGGRTGATVSHRHTERRPLRLLPCPRVRSDAGRDAPDHHGPSWGGHGLPPGCNLRELPPDRGRDRLPPHVSDRLCTRQCDGAAATRVEGKSDRLGETDGESCSPTSYPRADLSRRYRLLEQRRSDSWDRVRAWLMTRGVKHVIVA